MNRHGLYRGRLRHRRFSPKKHAFSYDVFMVYLDLDDMESFFSLSPLWSARGRALAQFRRKDFHGDDQTDLSCAVKRTVKHELDFTPEGRVFMLANLRYFGFIMNPLCTYYCFDKSGQNVEAIVAEVNNTPWNERRAYVLDVRDKNKVSFDKDFTVSPFNPLNMQYVWSSNNPGEALTIHIDCFGDDSKVLDASLWLKREELTPSLLNKTILCYPWMCMKVFLLIYWQALRLFLKGVPFLGKGTDKSKLMDEDRYETR